MKELHSSPWLLLLLLNLLQSGLGAPQFSGGFSSQFPNEFQTLFRPNAFNAFPAVPPIVQPQPTDVIPIPFFEEPHHHQKIPPRPFSYEYGWEDPEGLHSAKTETQDE